MKIHFCNNLDRGAAEGRRGSRGRTSIGRGAAEGLPREAEAAEELSFGPIVIKNTKNSEIEILGLYFDF